MVPSVANAEAKYKALQDSRAYFGSINQHPLEESLFNNFVLKIIVLVQLPYDSVSAMTHHSANSYDN